MDRESPTFPRSSVFHAIQPRQARPAAWPRLARVSLPSVRCRETAPNVLDLIEMRLRAVMRDGEPERARRQAAAGLDHRIGGHDPIPLRGDQVDAGVQEFLLRVEDV